MDPRSVQALNELNRQFYTRTAPEFDQTRQRAWQGWLQLIPYLKAPLSVLDLGCGNGRFGVFLAETLPGHVTYHGIDNNPALLAAAQASFASLPNLTATLTEQDLIEMLPEYASVDLVVVFGVIHHVPGAENRKKFLKALADYVAPGGMLCFASWRFYEYERFRDRFAKWPETITREEHDYLLDWRRGEHALRYCHYVDDREQAELIAVSGLEEMTTFRADGSDNRMNCYSLLCR